MAALDLPGRSRSFHSCHPPGSCSSRYHGAVGILQHRRFGLYLVPLFYLAQVAQVVAPGFVLSLYLLYKVDLTIGFEFGALGVNLLAVAMFLWSSLYAAGALDAADVLQADGRA